jgi:hypothetical protein
MVLILPLLAAGCGKPAPVELDTRGVKPALDWRPLASVLSQAVDSKGQVSPVLLERCAAELDAQLKTLAVTGPTATPALFATAEDRLAYWYNASAAWSMKLGLEAKFPEEMGDSELHDRPVPLDGRKMTLRQVSELLTADGDFRVGLLAPCVCVHGGPLPAAPLSGGNFRRRIDEMFNRYIDDPKRLVVDEDKREILFPPGLWRLRERLTADYNARYRTEGATLTTALMPLVRGPALRRLQDALGYREAPSSRSGLLALPEKFSFLKKALW